MSDRVECGLETNVAALWDEIEEADDIDDLEAAVAECIQIRIADAAADEPDLYGLDGYDISFLKMENNVPISDFNVPISDLIIALRESEVNR